MAINLSRPKLVRLVLFGTVTALLYAALFQFEGALIGFTQHGHWSFAIPIAAAFAVSYFHGGFTSTFWDVLGIQANKH